MEFKAKVILTKDEIKSLLDMLHLNSVSLLIMSVVEDVEERQFRNTAMIQKFEKELKTIEEADEFLNKQPEEIKRATKFVIIGGDGNNEKS